MFIFGNAEPLKIIEEELNHIPVTKPLTIEELREKINKLLERDEECQRR